MAGRRLPDTLSVADAPRGLLEEQIVRGWRAARARARGLDQDAALAARAGAGSAPALLATDEIARRIHQSLVRPTHAEKRAHYERNRERYRSPVQVDVSLILWPLDPAQPRDRFAEAEAVLAGCGREPDFDQAARQMSVHAPRRRAAGWASCHDGAGVGSGPNVFRTVEELAAGRDERRRPAGPAAYLVKLWERQPSRPLSYEEAAPARRAGAGQRPRGGTAEGATKRQRGRRWRSRLPAAADRLPEKTKGAARRAAPSRTSRTPSTTGS